MNNDNSLNDQPVKESSSAVSFCKGGFIGSCVGIGWFTVWFIAEIFFRNTFLFVFIRVINWPFDKLFGSFLDVLVGLGLFGKHNAIALVIVLFVCFVLSGFIIGFATCLILHLYRRIVSRAGKIELE